MIQGSDFKIRFGDQFTGVGEFRPREGEVITFPASDEFAVNETTSTIACDVTFNDLTTRNETEFVPCPDGGGSGGGGTAGTPGDGGVAAAAPGLADAGLSGPRLAMTSPTLGIAEGAARLLTSLTDPTDGELLAQAAPRRVAAAGDPHRRDPGPRQRPVPERRPHRAGPRRHHRRPAPTAACAAR